MVGELVHFSLISPASRTANTCMELTDVHSANRMHACMHAHHARMPHRTASLHTNTHTIIVKLVCRTAANCLLLLPLSLQLLLASTPSLRMSPGSPAWW